MSQPILLFGQGGQLGRELVNELALLAPVVAVGRADCDLGSVDAVCETIRRIAPAVIVNAAAYTAVDRAESERELAFAINARAVEAMAATALERNALMVHFSTDYVFAGDETRGYSEGDPTSPRSVYGASKLAGERALQESGARHFTFRLAWLYAMHGGNFLNTMLRLFRERDEVRVVADQHGSPTWAACVADAVGRVLRASQGDNDHYDAADDRLGLYHLSSGDTATWFDFAVAIHEMFPELRRVQRITPISTAEYPTPAVRPRSSVLSAEKFADAFRFRLPTWRDQLTLAAATAPEPV